MTLHSIEYLFLAYKIKRVHIKDKINANNNDQKRNNPKHHYISSLYEGVSTLYCTVCYLC